MWNSEIHVQCRLYVGLVGPSSQRWTPQTDPPPYTYTPYWRNTSVHGDPSSYHLGNSSPDIISSSPHGTFFSSPHRRISSSPNRRTWHKRYNCKSFVLSAGRNDIEEEQSTHPLPRMGKEYAVSFDLKATSLTIDYAYRSISHDNT